LRSLSGRFDLAICLMRYENRAPLVAHHQSVTLALESLSAVRSLFEYLDYSVERLLEIVNACISALIQMIFIRNGNKSKLMVFFPNKEILHIICYAIL
jgi:hypothetical protein